MTIINRILERGSEIKNMLEGRKIFKDLDSSKWYYKEVEEVVNGHAYKKSNKIEKWIRLHD